MNYRKYMQSQAWKEKRQAKLDACSEKCECEGGCIREATQVHHLHYDNLGNESLDDLQALCAKCHMQKSKVRNFYGSTSYDCCEHQPKPLSDNEQEFLEEFIELNPDVLLRPHYNLKKGEKILPYHVYHEALFHWQMNKHKYERIAKQLGCEPVIASLLDNLGIMFGCGDIEVCDAVTEALGRFVDIVEGDHWLSGYAEVAYQIKPEFQKVFPTEEY